MEILEPAFKHGFGVVPFVILRNPKIAPELKTLYLLILSYAWYEGLSWPGQKRLAMELGLSESTVRRQLNQLKNLGLLSWKQRGLNQTNLYTINQIPKILVRAFEENQHKIEVDRAELTGQDRAQMTDKIDEEEIDEEFDICGLQNSVDPKDKNGFNSEEDREGKEDRSVKTKPLPISVRLKNIQWSREELDNPSLEDCEILSKVLLAWSWSVPASNLKVWLPTFGEYTDNYIEGDIENYYAFVVSTLKKVWEGEEISWYLNIKEDIASQNQF